MKKRPYRMRKRALDQKRTRQRIVEAAIELHATLGPRNTSISAVAQRAGVQRLTVYRHFPDESALYRACSSHWLSRHPPPNPATWSSFTADAAARTSTALAAIYDYYRRTNPILSRVYRDLGEVESLRGPVKGFQGYLDSIRDDLATAWRPGSRKPRLLLAVLSHVLAFSTWASLSGLGLSDKQVAGLALNWIRATHDSTGVRQVRRSP